MQQKSEKFSEYSERSEALASNLGINVSDLPAKIGVSPSMFHAYRSGKYPISDKAWRKLEGVEEAYARTHLEAAKATSERLLAEQKQNPINAKNSGDPKLSGIGNPAYEGSAFLREEPSHYRTEVDPVAAAFAKMREGLDLLEQLMKERWK